MDNDMVAAVEAVLEAASPRTGDLSVPDRQTYTFGVILNALQSVLEELRAEDPGLAHRFRSLAVTVLSDD